MANCMWPRHPCGPYAALRPNSSAAVGHSRAPAGYEVRIGIVSGPGSASALESPMLFRGKYPLGIPLCSPHRSQGLRLTAPDRASFAIPDRRLEDPYRLEIWLYAVTVQTTSRFR